MARSKDCGLFSRYLKQLCSTSHHHSSTMVMHVRAASRSPTTGDGGRMQAQSPEAKFAPKFVDVITCTYNHEYMQAPTSRVQLIRMTAQHACNMFPCAMH